MLIGVLLVLQGTDTTDTTTAAPTLSQAYTMRDIVVQCRYCYEIMIKLAIIYCSCDSRATTVKLKTDEMYQYVTE